MTELLITARRIVLPILRSLSKVYGPVSVIVRFFSNLVQHATKMKRKLIRSSLPIKPQHFDAHIDTWDGSSYVGAFTDQAKIVRIAFLFGFL